MKLFTYEIGMTEEVLSEKVREMIEYMRTDEYWLERGGNGPYFDEGGELMKKYLDTTDWRRTQRKETLIVPYNRVLQMNMFRPVFVNRPAKPTVSLTMMSGKEVEINLEHIVSYADLVNEARKVCKITKNIKVSIVDGERVLSSSNPRLIITDETVLTLVLSKRK